MSFSPFNEADIDDAKEAFALALDADQQANPFGKPDPFRAALTIWNEDNGELNKALWVAHSARWHESDDVLAIIDDLKEERKKAVAELHEAKIPKTAEEVRLHILRIGYEISNNTQVEARDRIAALDRMAKAAGADLKGADEPDAGRVLGVIHHRLQPMNHAEFSAFARQQQSELQGELAGVLEEAGGENARLIN